MNQKQLVPLTALLLLLLTLCAPAPAQVYTYTTNNGAITRGASKANSYESIHFTVHPQTQVVAVGDTIRLSIVATGGSPSFQWEKQPFGGSWESVSGATGAALTISNAQITHRGNYRVVVTDGTDHVTSSTAAVGVLTIDTQPVAVTTMGVGVGQRAQEFTPIVGASAGHSTLNATLTYQWQKSSDGTTFASLSNGITPGGNVISGASSKNLSVANVRIVKNATNVLVHTDGGTYRVAVSSSISGAPIVMSGNALLNLISYIAPFSPVYINVMNGTGTSTRQCRVPNTNANIWNRYSSTLPSNAFGGVEGRLWYRRVLPAEDFTEISGIGTWFLDDHIIWPSGTTVEYKARVTYTVGGATVYDFTTGPVAVVTVVYRPTDCP